MPLRIAQTDLSKMKAHLSERAEICGVVVPPDNAHVGLIALRALDVGPPIQDGERGSCRSTNRWVNFHTHPTVVWPWPSTEDMFKVLYDRGHAPILWGSLIFTAWGIWEIYSPTKVDPNVLEDEEEWWTVHASDDLFYALGLDKDPTVPSLSTASSALERYLDIWDEGFGEIGLEVTLTGWDAIDKDYLFQTGLGNVPHG